MLFKNLKCVQISESEYEDVSFIINVSSCPANAEDNLADYLIKDKKVDVNLHPYVLKQLAYNLYSAVMNDYKYMKVVKKEAKKNVR